MKNLPFLFVVVLIVACNNDASQKSATDTTFDTAAQAKTAGSDKDEHGCIGSAGYNWSVLKKECIRLFEVGLRLNPVEKTEGATLSAFVIFSADSAQAELFLPGQEKSEILDRRGKPGAYAWNVEDDDTKNIRKLKGEWIIEQRTRVLYKEAK